MWKYANPNIFMRVSGRFLPWMIGLCVGLLIVGVYHAIYLVPADYRQGDAARIMFVHVPAAALSIMIYVVIVMCSLVGYIWRHPVAYLCAKSAAPVGAMLTALTLVTGAIWGKPMWGTWWEWEPRLTFEFILFWFYIAYIAAWQIFDEDILKAGAATTVVAVVGSIFAILSKYAVLLWKESLHQLPSMSLDAQTHLDSAYHIPLLMMIAGFWLYFAIMTLLGARLEIRKRRIAVMQRQAARKQEQ